MLSAATKYNKGISSFSCKIEIVLLHQIRFLKTVTRQNLTLYASQVQHANLALQCIAAVILR